jgi:preprotein translocase subunit SecG
MMAFYILIYSIACIAVVIAVLMHWPNLDDPDDKSAR